MRNFFEASTFALTSLLQLEHSLPGGGLGKTKKDIILNAIQLAAKVGESAGAVNPLIALVSQFIDSTVQSLNSAGVFTKIVAAAA
jgi:hypothetical protein